MIFLDTNVASELMRHPTMRHQDVTIYFDNQSLDDLYLPCIAMAEIRYGIVRLPEGKRRAGIEQAFQKLLSIGFADRVVKFSASCAEGYATARTAREKSGRPVSMQDALIGGMALAYGATLVTRNIADFDGYGLTLVDPWAQMPPRK